MKHFNKLGNIIGSREGGKQTLKGADMAKHITKTVIEDIAYELKRAGLHFIAWQQGEAPEDIAIDTPDKMLDYIILQLAEVLIEHDPSFSKPKWLMQTEYKVEY